MKVERRTRSDRPLRRGRGTTRQRLARSQMKNSRAILKKRENLCTGTTGLYFEKPDGFVFKPGQFANFTIDSAIATDAGGNTRTLSIASAPHEKELMVAMRMRDTGFKRAAEALPIGATFLLEGPYGNLILLRRDVNRPAVFPCRRDRNHAFSEHDQACNGGWKARIESHCFIRIRRKPRRQRS